jgi:hypothetical protein
VCILRRPFKAVSAVRAGEPLLERLPAYVSRDTGDELRQRLTTSGFVIVVGDSSAGKSRTIHEAIAAQQDHVLIVPETGTPLLWRSVRRAGGYTPLRSVA